MYSPTTPANTGKDAGGRKYTGHRNVNTRWYLQSGGGNNNGSDNDGGDNDGGGENSGEDSSGSSGGSDGSSGSAAPENGKNPGRPAVTPPSVTAAPPTDAARINLFKES